MSVEKIRSNGLFLTLVDCDAAEETSENRLIVRHAGFGRFEFSMGDGDASFEVQQVRELAKFLGVARVTEEEQA